MTVPGAAASAALGERVRGFKAAWHGLAPLQRTRATVAALAVIAIPLGFIDTSLGIGIAAVAALYGLSKLPGRTKAVGQAALVIAFAYPEPSFAAILAVFFAVGWLPQHIRRWAQPGVALAAACAYPFFLDKLFTVPLLGAFPGVNTGVAMVVFIMMAVGLNVVVGYAGLLDLGYVAFYAFGAYTTAWLASLQFSQVKLHIGSVGIIHSQPGLHLSIWMILPIAGIITALAGVVIGLPTLRLRGDYLAIVTLGFGEILPQVARNGADFGGFNLTNGPNGITPIDAPGFGHTIARATGNVIPADFLSDPSGQNLYYWTAIGLLVVTVFACFRLRDSRLGRAWVAIREDEIAASAMGIPLMRTKTWAYASGAFFGGVAGAYYASFKSAAFPGDFFFNISIFILSMVILGGMGNIWGVIVGAALLSYLDREGLANIGSWINQHFHTHVDVPLYQTGIFGLIIILVMLFRPEGLIPSRRRKAELHEGVHDQPLYDVVHEGS